MISEFYIILDQLEKPPFDAHIDGVLLDSKKDVIPVIFNRGKILNPQENEVFFIVADKDYTLEGKFRDKLSVIVNSSNPLFIVSQKLEFLLKEVAPEQVEFFNIVIQNVQTEITEYKIANIINRIDCIDYEKSDLEFEFYDDEEPCGDILATYSLVLKENNLPNNLNIFLMDHYKDTIIVIHERLKRQIEIHNITGLVFCNIVDFQL